MILCFKIDTNIVIRRLEGVILLNKICHSYLSFRFLHECYRSIILQNQADWFETLKVMSTGKFCVSLQIIFKCNPTTRNYSLRKAPKK